MKRLALALLMVGLLPAAAQAAWSLQQGQNRATTTYSDGRYQLTLTCERGRGLEMTLVDATQRGDTFGGLRAVMFWFTLPDGRTDRWPVDVSVEGPSLSGQVVVSDFNLEFFRQGQSFQLDAPQTGTVFLEGNMNGTGAARLAFLERCGI